MWKGPMFGFALPRIKFKPWGGTWPMCWLNCAVRKAVTVIFRVFTASSRPCMKPDSHNSRLAYWEATSSKRCGWGSITRTASKRWESSVMSSTSTSSITCLTCITTSRNRISLPNATRLVGFWHCSLRAYHWPWSTGSGLCLSSKDGRS